MRSFTHERGDSAPIPHELVQKNVELGLATGTRQKLGEKLSKAIGWDKTRSGRS